MSECETESGREEDRVCERVEEWENKREWGSGRVEEWESG